MEGMNVHITDVSGPLYFHHILERAGTSGENVILGDSIVFGIIKADTITYSLPGMVFNFLKFLRTGFLRGRLKIRSNNQLSIDLALAREN